MNVEFLTNEDDKVDKFIWRCVMLTWGCVVLLCGYGLLFRC